MCHSVCSLCASGRVKIKTTDEKQGNLITFSTVPILQSAAPKLQSIAIPTPLTDHPLNFTACCCISHHQHGCTQLFAALPWLIHARWWTHWYMFTRQKCVYIQKKWALGIYDESTYCWRNCWPKIYWVIYSHQVVFKLQKAP